MDWYGTFVSNRRQSWRWDNLYKNIRPYVESMFGYSQMSNTQKSLQAQIDYEQYLKAGNQRALDDWYKNVGSKGRTIRYPEFTYPGQIMRSNTAITRAYLDYDTAGANYYGNLPYRASGLYSVGSRLFRTM